MVLVPKTRVPQHLSPSQGSDSLSREDKKEEIYSQERIRLMRIYFMSAWLTPFVFVFKCSIAVYLCFVGSCRGERAGYAKSQLKMQDVLCAVDSTDYCDFLVDLVHASGD